MAAEQKARSTYEYILDLTDDPDVIEPIRFLREREVVHFQRFGEALRIVRDYLDSERQFVIPKPDFMRPDMHKPSCKKPEYMMPDMHKPSCPKPECMKPDMHKPSCPKPEYMMPDMTKPACKRPTSHSDCKKNCGPCPQPRPYNK